MANSHDLLVGNKELLSVDQTSCNSAACNKKKGDGKPGIVNNPRIDSNATMTCILMTGHISTYLEMGFASKSVSEPRDLLNDGP